MFRHCNGAFPEAMQSASFTFAQALGSKPLFKQASTAAMYFVSILHF
jgi:hypothetical protein